MSFDSSTISLSNQSKCEGCGALLYYEPGTTYLKCIYCGAQNQIVTEENASVRVASIDYDEFTKAIGDISDSRYTIQTEVVKCENCGATSALDKHITADLCAFCATPLVIDHHVERVVRPHGVIPFALIEQKVKPLFLKWAGSLWFAPNDFKKIFNTSNLRLKGVYIPFWSYDAEAYSEYQGERGEYYYVNVVRRGADGKDVNARERRTRWYDADGDIHNTFEDVLVTASQSLPEDFANKIGPWNMQDLKAFDDRFLNGFVAETFTVDHIKGAVAAKRIMDREVGFSVRRKIGGDEQRIHHINTTYDAIKLKYVLLPVWLSAYQYNNKAYQIMVNAFTGKVYGQRPYSYWKIAGAILLVIILIVIFFVASS